MKTRHHFAPFGSLRGALGYFGELPLHFCQCLFLLPKEARIVDVGAIGEIGKRASGPHQDPPADPKEAKLLARPPCLLFCRGDAVFIGFLDRELFFWGEQKRSMVK
jgi:hypothetical protein